jgi:hypothetical protein
MLNEWRGKTDGGKIDGNRENLYYYVNKNGDIDFRERGSLPKKFVCYTMEEFDNIKKHPYNQCKADPTYPKIAIMGHKQRGSEVIAILKNWNGGKANNYFDATGKNPNFYYFVKDGRINCTTVAKVPNGYEKKTLPEINGEIK